MLVTFIHSFSAYVWSVIKLVSILKRFLLLFFLCKFFLSFYSLSLSLSLSLFFCSNIFFLSYLLLRHLPLSSVTFVLLPLERFLSRNGTFNRLINLLFHEKMLKIKSNRSPVATLLPSCRKRIWYWALPNGCVKMILASQRYSKKCDAKALTSHIVLVHWKSVLLL